MASKDGTESTRLRRLIRAARKGADMTQEELAEAADISFGYVKKLEYGELTNPSGKVIRKLSGALGVAEADLLDACH